MDFGKDLPTRPGEVFAGKYRVDRVLGAGGMGVVVAATHMDLGERRAVKFMLPSSVGDTVALERFFREARAAAKLKSDHVARVHDVGRTEQMAPYIVMEYLEGHDLSSLLGDGPLPIDRAVDYVIQACDAIAEAHAAGIVHRDLKPANLFLTTGADGSPCIKVLDFGISKVGDAGAPSQLTDTEATVGSPFHMSPEQMRASRAVDHRTDIWSLGVVLYQLVTGALPFQGEGRYAVCFAIAEDRPAMPRSRRRDVPPALEAAILRCLEKKPEARFQDVAMLCEAIAAFSPAPETAVRVRRIRRLVGGRIDDATTDGGSARRAAPIDPRSAFARTGPGDGATQSTWGKDPLKREKGRRVSFAIAASLVTIAALAGAARFLLLRPTSVAGVAATHETSDPTTAVAREATTIAPVAPAPEAPVSVAPTPSASSDAAPSAAPTAQPSAVPSATASAKPANVPRPWSVPVRPAAPPAPAPAPADPWGRTRKL